MTGNNEAERMSNALRMVLTVSKRDLLNEKAEKRKREKKRKKAG